MTRTRRPEALIALALLAPFLLTYAVLFVWPTAQLVALTFTKAPLIGAGDWVGFGNYERLWKDRLFWTATWNTLYFVLLTVIPSTLLGLAIALGVNRLKGWAQSLMLAAFFLPYILPVSVVYRIWSWLLDGEFGLLQVPIAALMGENVPVFRVIPLFIPTVALVTVWWLVGFNVLLFIAGLRNISAEIYEAAALDGATRGQMFRRITWPLIWPITVLVATIQLILQLKIFDQIYLFAQGGRTDATLSMVGLIYRSAFQKNQGGYGATVALVLFLLIVAVSVLQYQLLRARGQR
ncbi:carbohydrate ABC transporter permease [Rubellimicrobium aerolatum]|uniref:Carbohydrate ABC transporter permease n=1 Tax=Rubellimicrobium aerolatum TaxID=490979 RepID=A0ABW0SF40_9RHOB|nr:sugar ABC transporter permease [Rubellimicrobium aerolatum]MBP1807093.1 multiple sugar transport system permease protein [Rubellimicrobium aerolatum]